MRRDIRVHMAYTIKKVAQLSGVSVRTLHFYDEIFPEHGMDLLARRWGLVHTSPRMGGCHGWIGNLSLRSRRALAYLASQNGGVDACEGLAETS